MSFRGALIRKTANQEILHNNFTTISWGESVYDTDSFWDSGANARLTVPAGVSAVQLICGLRWIGFSGTTIRLCETLKGGAIFRGGGSENYSHGSSSGTLQSLVTPPVPVSEGDYFEWHAWQNSFTVQDVLNADETFACLRVVDELRGAMVYRTENQSLTNGTPASVSWQASEYDTDGVWDAGNPTRLTVPSGVERVRMYGGLIWASGSGSRFCEFHKNGAQFSGGSGEFYSKPIGRCRQSLASSIVEVSPGDYFELRGMCVGDSVSIEHDGGARTYFAMEAI